MNRMNRCISPAFVAAVLSLLLAGCVSAFVKPSDMVALGEVAGPGETKTMRIGSPEGTGGGIYTVPDGRVLVITRAIIQPMNPGSGSLDITFLQSDAAGDRIRHTWRVPRIQPTEYDFTPGEQVSAGSTLKIRNNSGSDAAVRLYGYVTAPE